MHTSKDIARMRQDVVDAPAIGSRVMHVPQGSGVTGAVVQRALRLASTGTVAILSSRRAMKEHLESRLPDGEGRAGVEVLTPFELVGRDSRFQAAPRLFGDTDWANLITELSREEGGSLAELSDDEVRSLAEAAAIGEPGEPGAERLVERLRSRIYRDGWISMDLLPHLLRSQPDAVQWDHLLVADDGVLDVLELPQLEGMARQSLMIMATSRREFSGFGGAIDSYQMPEPELQPIPHRVVTDLATELVAALDELVAAGPRLAVVATSRATRRALLEPANDWADRHPGVDLRVLGVHRVTGLQFDGLVSVLGTRPATHLGLQLLAKRRAGEVIVLVEAEHYVKWEKVLRSGDPLDG